MDRSSRRGCVVVRQDRGPMGGLGCRFELPPAPSLSSFATHHSHRREQQRTIPAHPRARHRTCRASCGLVWQESGGKRENRLMLGCRKQAASLS